MATITGYTAARMKEIEDTTVVSGSVTGDNLTLLQRDSTPILAGNVRGPTGSPGVTTGELAAALAISTPIGSVTDYIGETAPTNWLTMTGQTIVGGQSTYPILWDRIPASMKSGSNIVMPDTRGRVTVGLNTGDTDFNTIGKFGGGKTATISIPQLPSHTHTQQQHLHTQPQHFHTTNNHQHTMAHGHGDTIAYAETPAHTHGPYQITAHNNQRDFLMRTDNYNQIGLVVRSWAPGGSPSGGTEMGLAFVDSGSGRNVLSAGSHSHTKSGGVTSATTSALSGMQNPSTNPFTPTINNATAVNNDTGNGEGHPNLQPYITFLKIIRAA